MYDQILITRGEMICELVIAVMIGVGIGLLIAMRIHSNIYERK